MKKLNVDYDIFADMQTPLKNSQSDIHKEHIENLIYQLMHGYPKPYEPSPYYPIVEEAWKQFKDTQ